jgi:hypothetical protein
MGAQAAILSCSLCAVPVVPEEEGEDGGGGAVRCRQPVCRESARGRGRGGGRRSACCRRQICAGTDREGERWAGGLLPWRRCSSWSSWNTEHRSGVGERKEGLAGLAASPRGRMNRGGASYDLAVQRKGEGCRRAGDRLRTGGGQVGQAVGGGACEPGEKPKGSRAPARRPARAGEGVEKGNGQKGAAGRGGTGRVNELGFGRFFELIIYDVGTSGSGVARLLFSCRVRPLGVLGGGPRPV